MDLNKESIRVLVQQPAKATILRQVSRFVLMLMFETLNRAACFSSDIAIKQTSANENWPVSVTQSRPSWDSVSQPELYNQFSLRWILGHYSHFGNWFVQTPTCESEYNQLCSHISALERMKWMFNHQQTYLSWVCLHEESRRSAQSLKCVKERERKRETDNQRGDKNDSTKMLSERRKNSVLRRSFFSIVVH